MTLFVTGQGSVVGSAISSAIRICANPDTYRARAEEMDVNAGDIMEARRSIDEVGREVRDLVLAVARGQQTAPGALGHREFNQTCQSFDPIGPACLPGAA